ncbi:MAG: hypothetical protein M1457_13555 [bacterium]|nr:hypothetical protein [bacterium]
MKRRALVSVSDKTGLVDFCRRLVEIGFEIISTDGTLHALQAAGIAARQVSEVTGVPEILGGRVKTIHPMIFGGILARRPLTADMDTLREYGILPIDLVVVNLSPFVPGVAAGPATGGAQGEEAALELIDIGGSSLLRAAAKNHRDVYAVVDPADYPLVLDALLSAGRNADYAPLRRRLAAKVFEHTARYDRLIHDYLARAADSDTGTTELRESRP